jgi:hypothetical protein
LGPFGSRRLFLQLLFAPRRQPTYGQTGAHGFFFAANGPQLISSPRGPDHVLLDARVLLAPHKYRIVDQNHYLEKLYKLKTNTRLKKLTGPKKHNRSIQERTFLLKMKTPKSDTHFSAVESSSDVPLLLLVSFGGGNLNSNLAAIQIGILHGGKKYLHQNII